VTICSRDAGTPFRRILAHAILVALSGATSLALAQAAPPAEPDPTDPTAQAAPSGSDANTQNLDVISVTGYAASVQKAIEIKRDTTAQVDVIMAEDVGKFPDQNLAESLQRIPGVEIVREGGEGRQISVRGLDADFVRIRIDGMEALSTTGANDNSGGNNRGRSFDFNVFASELFNSIVVHKTDQANIGEGSLGATVDLNTPHPFDFNKTIFASNVQGGYGEYAKKNNYKASFLFSTLFAGGSMGITASAAYSRRNIVEEGSGTVRWDNGTSSGGFNAASTFAEALLPTTFIPRIPRYQVYTYEKNRLGLTGSYQWQITDHTLLTVDGLHARYSGSRSESDLEAISFSRTGAGKPQMIVTDGFVDPATGNLLYGKFDNVDMRVESRVDELETEFGQITAKLEQQFTPDLKLTLFSGHSRSDFNNPVQTTITLDHLDADGYSYDYRGNDRAPVIDYGFDVTDPAQWKFGSGSEIRLRPNTTANIFTNQRADLAYDFNDHIKLSGGIDYKAYKFDTTELRRLSETSVPNLPAGVSLADITQVVSYGSDLGAAGNTPTSWVVPDLAGFEDVFDIYCNCGTFTLTTANSSAAANNRYVKEADPGGYVQLDFNATLFDLPLRGNVGDRYVRTEQSSFGLAAVNGVLQAVTVDRPSYNNNLPSMNLALSLSDELILRYGMAKVMARPGLGNLTPGVRVSVSGSSRTVTSGNPLLDPFKANTADLALEWYFGERSLLSGALFYKDVNSFVQQLRYTQAFKDSGLPASLLDGTGASPEDDFNFSIPLNSPGGKIKGYEISYQQGFTFLPGFWKDFGAQLNYTHAQSEVKYLNTNGEVVQVAPLVGLSKASYNATLYYDNGVFSARVSLAHRDGYLTTIPGRNNNDVEGTKSTSNVDASASWNVNEWLSLQFSAINLTNEANDQYIDSVGDRSVVYTKTGREYYAGFRVKF
jgi:TonB-dependent receptor